MFTRHGQLSCLVKLSNVSRRFASINARIKDPSKIRNMAIVAHIDSGKTTLTESILLKSDYLSTPGTVDGGSTTTDFLPAERERGITIQSASIPVYWKDWTFNLIDTPGHADFGMEVESASRVVDGAVVVIDSAQGVEPQTKGVWRQLDKYNLKGRIMLMNKLDRAGASIRASLLSVLSNRLHPQPLLLTVPVASFDPQDYQRAEPGISGLVDLIKWELLTSKDGTTQKLALPTTIEEFSSIGFSSVHPIPKHLFDARTNLLESISMLSEPFMEVLLGSPDANLFSSIKPSTVLPILRELTLQGKALPVLCGSAIQHTGTELLLDYIGELLPTPLDCTPPNAVTSTEMQALAWKVTWDRKRGWMTFVRVYSGTLNARHGIMNTTRNEKERPSKFLLLFADREVVVDSLPFGSVGVILGLKHTRAGDTLVSHAQSKGLVLPNISPPPAVISSSLIPMSYSDEQPLTAAVTDLIRTDPSIRFESNEGQMLIHALGPLHLEILASRLRDEWNVKFELGTHRVSYRETITDELQIEDTWSTNVQGSVVEIKLQLSARPLDESKGEVGLENWGNNLVFSSGVPLLSPSSSSVNTVDNALSQGIYNAIMNSPHTSLPYTNLYISITAVETPISVQPALLTGAAAHVLMNAFKAHGLGTIMEPYVEIHVDVQEQHVGQVISDIGLRGGEILDLESGSDNGTDDMEPYSYEGLYIPPEWVSPCSSSSNASKSAEVVSRRTVSARGPLAHFLDFSQKLKSITGGHGLFSSTNIGYRAVSETRRVEILQEMGRL